MAHRRSEKGGRLLKGADAGNHLHIDSAPAAAGHLEGQRRHAVDAGIAGADHTHIPASGCYGEGLFQTVHFLMHAGSVELRVGSEKSLHKGKIITVAHKGAAAPQGVDCSQSHVAFAARPNSYNRDLTHFQYILWRHCL